MSSSSWNEIVCFSIDAMLPGLPMTEDEVQELIDDDRTFAPGQSSFGDPELVDGKLESLVIQVADIQYCSHHFQSGAWMEIDSLSFFDIFGGNMVEIMPLYELIKEVIDKTLEEREKRDRLPFHKKSTSRDSFHVRFSLPVLVRVWSDYDSYTMESDGGVEVLRAIDLNKLRDKEDFTTRGGDDE